MNVERQQRALAIFQQLCDIPPADRGLLLERECGHDSALRRTVERLLAHDEQPHAFVDAASLGRAAELVGLDSTSPVRDAAAPIPLPMAVGNYRLISRIGEGGMGAVYEAEQENPRRIVALKLIRPGSASQQVLRRFEHEAQVLGQLHHPGIAQIYEAGMHTDVQGVFGPVGGRVPYFVMERIHGQPLDVYVVESRATTRARLELLAKVCDAVHYAHQKGVIHRDLKPGNILVDEFGQPRVLDFGVARVTNSNMQATMQTDLGQLVGTLAYMSPEQVTGRQDLLDLRSDVYALGVILYELVAGRPPYEIRGQTVPEAVRIIREEEPSRLSSIDSRFRGDVETIVAKALEKDKARRYASAAELGADIRRHLCDEPIAARPASTFYQLRKFANRNKGLVRGLAVALLVLVAGTASSIAFALREAHQRRLADARTNDAQRLAYTASVAAATAALGQDDIDLAAQNLQRAPAALRGWEWQHLQRAAHSSHVTFPDSAGWVDSADLSRDEKTFITIARDGSTAVWDLPSRSVRKKVRVSPQTTYQGARVSPDGSLLLLGGGGSGGLEVWDLLAGQHLWTRPAGAARSGDFTPDGRYVVLGSESGRSIQFHDARSGIVARGLTFSLEGPSWITCSASGKRLLADNVLVDLESGRQRRLSGYIAYLNPDETEYACVEDNALRIQRLDDDSILALRPWPLGRELRVIRWLEGGHGLVVAYKDGPADFLNRALDPVGQSLLPRILRHASILSDARTALTFTEDGKVQLWDLLDNAVSEFAQPLWCVGVSAAFSPDRRRMVIGDWGQVRLHGTASGAPLWCSIRPRGMHTVVAFSGDGERIAAGDGFNYLNVLAASDGRLLERVAFAELPLSLQWRPRTAQFLAGGAHGGVVLLDSDAPRVPLRRLTGHTSPVNALAISPDDRTAASGSGDGVSYPEVGVQTTGAGDNSVRIWRLESGQCERVIACEHPVLALAYSPDGRSLAGALENGMVLVWDVVSGAATVVSREAELCRALVYHPSGNRLVACSEGGIVRVWNVRDGYLAATLPTHIRNTVAAAFTADGATFLASSSGMALLRMDSAPTDADLVARFHQSWAGRRIAREQRGLLADIEIALRADQSLPPAVLDAAIQTLATMRDPVAYLMSDALVGVRRRTEHDAAALEVAARRAARARELVPEDPSPAYVHGLALYYLGRSREALAAAERSVALATSDARTTKIGALVLSALCLDQLGERDAARIALASGRTLARDEESLPVEARELLEAAATLDR